MAQKLFLLLIILTCGFGCGLLDRAQKAVSDQTSETSTNGSTSNKSLTDTAVDTAVGDTKIGIQECDEALDILTAQANDPNDNFVVKAGKKTALNMFRDQLKKNLEENKTDKKDLAKFCKDFRDNLQESLSEQNSNTAK